VKLAEMPLYDSTGAISSGFWLMAANVRNVAVINGVASVMAKAVS